MAIIASALVVLVIAVLVLVKVTGGSSPASSVRTSVTDTALSQLAGVPISSMVGAANTARSGTVVPPTNLPSGTPPLTSGGKPQILYVGAEYCPFCAAERWAIVMALSKFGTFSNLASTKSSSTDTNPNTPTFSFYGSTYASQYLTFTAVELQNRAGQNLQTPTAEQKTVISTYDAAPYVTGQAGSIPFIDLGGRYIVSGTEYDGSLMSNQNFDAVLGEMATGTTSTAQAARAAAAHLVGVICSLTGDQPVSVCSAVPSSLKTGVAGSGNQGSSTGG